MINATPGWAAYFKQEAGDFTSKAVEAWDDDGDALVVGRTELVPARNFNNFSHIGRCQDGPYPHAVPGQGWYIERTNDEGQSWKEPVIAFAIDWNGEGAVICGSGDGEVVLDMDLDGEKNILTPPGGWSTPADQPTGKTEEPNR